MTVPTDTPARAPPRCEWWRETHADDGGREGPRTEPVGSASRVPSCAVEAPPFTANEDVARKRAGIDSDDAALSAANATLRTLSERLSEGKAADLALYLPETLEEVILESNDEPATDYSLDEFTQRVSQREGVEKADAKIHARAVCITLAETVSTREIDAIKKAIARPVWYLLRITGYRGRREEVI